MIRSPQLVLVVLLTLFAVAPAHAGTCVPSSTVACFQDGRFSATIDWMDFDTNTGSGQVLPLGVDETTVVWFADPELPDLYLKVLDGTQVNNFFWVFYGSLSNWEFTITVTDTETGEAAVYFNPLGTFDSVADTAALPGTAPAAALPAFARIGREPAMSTVDGPLACVPDATTLCIEGGRFRVVVDWEDFGGVTGQGDAMPVTGQSGYFALFGSQVDLMVKLFDGGQGSFGFFYGATTTIEYTITVTDVCTGATQEYLNPLGVGPSSFGDFNAFPATPTCLPIFADGFESGNTSAWLAGL
ncbi:MAG: hypothetical protein AAF657_13755 [Acidobacteriota bacterium]